MLRESEKDTTSKASKPSWRWYAFAVVALVVGAILRFMWGGDIEYKFDESYMFQRAVNAGITEPMPSVGMRSGAGVANPGLSIWLFIAMARLFAVHTPPELARIVQASNVAALGLGMVFGFVMVNREEWRTWTWAVALACVNPFAVLFGRKIWAQSMLPLFCVLTIMAWWKRETRSGAFVWGLFGALLGQIHFSGFFFAGSLLLWTLVGDRSMATARERQLVHWHAWVVGSVLGSVTLLPWIAHLATHGISAREHNFLAVLLIHNVLGLWYWVLWVTGALGIGLSYSLGIPEFLAFLKYPLVGATPTYLMAVAHSILFGLGTWLLLRRAWQTGDRRFEWQEVVLGGGSSVQRLVMASFVGYGLLLLATGFPIYRHYLVVTFPLQWTWLSRQVRLGGRSANSMLVVIWICQLGISAGFLYYIHVNHGALSGDYGATYIYQH